MLFQKKRVEEDLERIRNSNLFINENAYHEHKEKLELEKNDILAMILAIFSIILPYILVFVAIMCSAIMLIYYLF